MHFYLILFYFSEETDFFSSPAPNSGKLRVLGLVERDLSLRRRDGQTSFNPPPPEQKSFPGKNLLITFLTSALNNFCAEF